ARPRAWVGAEAGRPAGDCGVGCRTHRIAGFNAPDVYTSVWYRRYRSGDIRGDARGAGRCRLGSQSAPRPPRNQGRPHDDLAVRVNKAAWELAPVCMARCTLGEPVRPTAQVVPDACDCPRYPNVGSALKGSEYLLCSAKPCIEGSVHSAPVTIEIGMLAGKE